MANLFTKALNNLTTKGHVIPLTSHDTTYLSLINNFFGFIIGKHGQEQYAHAYGENPLVYMIVNKIACTTAAINRVYLNNDGEIIEDSRSDLAQIMEQPNRMQTLQDFYEDLLENLLLTGNAYIRRVNGVAGMGTELISWVSYRVEINANNIGEVISYTYVKPDGSQITVAADEVLHIRMSNVVNVDNTNIHYGLSPLQASWIVVQSSTEKFKADASIFKNRGIVGILTNASDNAMLPQERKRLQEEYDNEVGGSDKYNKIKVTTARLQYIQTGMSPTDLKLLEGIMSSLRTLCSIYGISSILFNDNENSTYNNVAEAKRDAFINVYLPLAKKVDTKISAWLSDTEIITTDLTSIEEVKAATNETSQALNNMSPLLANRVLEAMTIDEIRELANLEELPDGSGEGLSGGGATNVNANVNG